MLSSLKITNLAVIDSLEIHFEPGLNIFTGETGAGKSIIMSALSLILGERASIDYLRAGCETARVQAVFDTGPDLRVARVLESSEIPLTYEGHAEDEVEDRAEDAVSGQSQDLSHDASGAGALSRLHVEREISRSGKNRCYVNSQQVPLIVLRELGDLLVDIHGQHDHQRLLNPVHHLGIVDEFGDPKFRKLRGQVQKQIKRLSDLTAQIRELTTREQERTRELDLARSQLEEIETARIDPVADSQVEGRLRLLGNLERVRREAAEVVEGLTSDQAEASGALTVLRTLLPRVEYLAQTCADEQVTRAAASFREALYLLDDVTTTIRHSVEGLDFDEEDLARVEARVGVLSRLKRRYGPGLEDVVATSERLAKQIERLTSCQEDCERLASEQKDLLEQLAVNASRLSKSRSDIAETLATKVGRHLDDLGLELTRFSVELTRAPAPDSLLLIDDKPTRCYPDGIDRAEFVFSPNPGEQPKSLARIASGGELSRVMLALKSSLAVLDRVPIMVFDEIDAGIGGTTSVKVAEKLRQVSRHCQSVVITHLPQIASVADAHFAVEKVVVGGRTQTRVRRLSVEERINELQRMLGGSGKVSREHAKELLANLSSI